MARLSIQGAALGYYIFFLGSPYEEPLALGQGERVSQMDTPWSQPSYSSTYHSPGGSIHPRTQDQDA